MFCFLRYFPIPVHTLWVLPGFGHIYPRYALTTMAAALYGQKRWAHTSVKGAMYQERYGTTKWTLATFKPAPTQWVPTTVAAVA